MSVDVFTQYLKASKESDDMHFTVAQRRWKRAIRIVLLRNMVKKVRKHLIGLGMSPTRTTTQGEGVQTMKRGRKLSTSFGSLPPINPRLLPKQKATREFRKTMGSRRESKDIAPIDWHHHGTRLDCPFNKLQEEINFALSAISGPSA